MIFLGVIFTIPSLIKEQLIVPKDFSKKLQSTEILICGDSRADQQLIPFIIKQETGKNVLNIAASSQDIYTWSKSLSATKVKGKIIIISASFFQINDGANDFPFFNLGTFSDLNFSEKMELYENDYFDLVLLQAKLAYTRLLNKNDDSAFGNHHRQINKDYYKKDCNSFEMSEDWLSRHTWYKFPSVDGVKSKMLTKAIGNLSKLEDCRIIIYNGPVSFKFKEEAKKTGVIKLEQKYNLVLKSLCENSGIRFVSFWDETELSKNEFYHDPQHLCTKGAETFSKKMATLLPK